MQTRTLVFLFAAATVGLACSRQAASRGPVDARQSIFPARPGGTLKPSDLAFGGGPWISSPRSGRIGLSEKELAAYLQPERLAKAKLAPPPAVAPTPVPAAQIEQAQASLVEEAKAADPDLERYAQREQRSRQLSDYRGGDAVVIGASTLVIVLLIVLLVVLLT